MKINTANVRRLADHLEANVRDAQFDMDFYLEVHHCGTVGCIAGYAAILARPGVPAAELERGDADNVYDIEGLAADFLGFDDQHADIIFSADCDFNDWRLFRLMYGVSRGEVAVEGSSRLTAVKVLRVLADRWEAREAADSELRLDIPGFSGVSRGPIMEVEPDTEMGGRR